MVMSVLLVTIVRLEQAHPTPVRPARIYQTLVWRPWGIVWTVLVEGSVTWMDFPTTQVRFVASN